MELIETVVVGAGPAGLRAAQVLAEAGRDVLVIERNEQIGPKTCAGGLTMKAVQELEALGLPPHEGRTTTAEISFLGEPHIRLNPARGAVRTIARAILGRYQACWTRRAGAAIVTGSSATDLNLTDRTLRVNGRAIRYKNLIGADGSASRVRRALGLPIRRDVFAGEFNVRGAMADDLQVTFDSAALGPGYFWVFPHSDYVSFGAGGPTSLLKPSEVRPYLERRLGSMGVDPSGTAFEAATIETDFRGLSFGNGVWLAGDAAGLASALTGEGIYPALVSGEEVARGILTPGYRPAKTLDWLRVKRVHEALARLWHRRPTRVASLRLLRAMSRVDPLQNKLASLFLG
ncbi:MAG TPA: NAD(P)/FAD-dependent oxidoreductase [Vicinamibacterales bacterium]|nr:NAD(P)/FAD-dependent oxidoreductase [Vicinamibacterales bacterium]